MQTKSENELRQEIVRLAQDFLARGLVVRSWGNFSARLDAESFLVTPSGLAYTAMQPEDLVRCSLADGTKLAGEKGKPSSEAPMHAILYRLFPEAQMAAHTHQVYASALSLVPDGLSFSGSPLPVGSYALPGSKRLHKNMEEALSCAQASAALMGRHGAFVFGCSPAEVSELAEALEKSCLGLWEKMTGRKNSHRRAIDAHRPEEEALAARFGANLPAGESLCVSLDPELQRLFSRTKMLEAWLDDFAQICGQHVGSLRKSNSVRYDRETQSALCFGQNPGDAENVRAVLEKNVRAAALAEVCDLKPLPLWECRLMRFVYLKKYSRQYSK